MEANEILEKLSLEEKLSLLSGINFWYTAPLPQQEIKSLMMADGPAGLRKQNDASKENGDLNHSLKAISYPAEVLQGATFNPEILEKLGQHLGQAAKSEDVGVLLGPGINIKRSPLGGRNFEYFSEDPFLTEALGTAYILGLQKEGVGATVKHFAANNRENQRFTNSSEVSERVLREIYLKAFEGVVKKAKPASIMASYNEINGIPATENAWLLESVLRQEWGYKGVVMSDWTAVSNQAKSVMSGLDLEMPGRGPLGLLALQKALTTGELTLEKVDEAALRILNLILTYGTEEKNSLSLDFEAHHEFAVKLAEEGMVLLKNEGGTLPLKATEKIALIGALAKTPRYQGSGSSHVNAYGVVTPYEAFQKASGEIPYAAGYDLTADKEDKDLLAEACAVGEKVDKVIVFLGFPEKFESEGFDKTSLSLPNNQLQLLASLEKIKKPLVVVLQNGSPAELPFKNKVAAILETYLAGEGVGEATYHLLTGAANPSGHLAETFPEKLSDNPTYGTFNASLKKEIYHEGLFVGYRYYDLKKITPAYPFGHGLSYTDFSYEDFAVLQKGNTVEVSVKVKNIGNVKGAAVPQLYVGQLSLPKEKAVKELKGFLKTWLEVNEEKTISFTLSKEDFRYFDEEQGKWLSVTGLYEFYLGESSEKIVAKKNLLLNFDPLLPRLSLDTYLIDLYQMPEISGLFFQYFGEGLMQSDFAAFAQAAKTRQLDLENPDIKMLLNVPLRALVAQGFPEEAFVAFITGLNQKLGSL